MTYSIVARDSRTGAFGLAVQSHWFNVGQAVTWVRYGVGAVVTQATTEPSYGWRGLTLMGTGMEPRSALRELVDGDANSHRRQVAMIDAAGRVAVHTGSGCAAYADRVVGDGWSVQGNLLANPSVIDAMAAGFEGAHGPLSERMLAALDAAQDAGGDLRGVQSAALRVVPGSTADQVDVGVDLRVADHEDPLGELKRIATVSQAYRALRHGTAAIDDGRAEDAIEQLKIASDLGHRVELGFWRAIGLIRLGHTDEAVDVLEAVVEAQATFAEVLERLATIDPDAAKLRHEWSQR